MQAGRRIAGRDVRSCGDAERRAGLFLAKDAKNAKVKAGHKLEMAENFRVQI
jgi:hypothetical protein